MKQPPSPLALSHDQRVELLEIARGALRARLDPQPHSVDRKARSAALRRKAGAFVSIHLHGQLRGCIGTFEAEACLDEVVERMAIAAGTTDPRFPPMTLVELQDAELEISVLSSRSPARPEEIELGRHGVYVTQGQRRGVLLPQVAAEHGWGREEFLDFTCRKAGLPAGSWRRDDVLVEIFIAEVFGDAAPSTTGA